MARPSLRGHRKFRRLVAMLRMPEAHVLGHLEMLWGAAYEDGNPVIGEDIDVELAAGWVGEPGELTQALAACGGANHAGFIEPVDGCPDEWQVHDLLDHAPEYVQKRAKREAERRARGRLVVTNPSPAGAERRTVADSGGQRPPTSDSGRQGTTTADGVHDPAPNGRTPAPAPTPAPREENPPLRGGATRAQAREGGPSPEPIREEEQVQRSAPKAKSAEKEREGSQRLELLEHRVPGFGEAWESWRAAVPVSKRGNEWADVLKLRAFCELSGRYGPGDVLDMLALATTGTQGDPWRGFREDWWLEARKRQRAPPGARLQAPEPPPPELPEVESPQWETIRAALEQQLDPEELGTWISPLWATARRPDEPPTVLRIGCPTEHHELVLTSGDLGGAIRKAAQALGLQLELQVGTRPTGF